MHTENYYNYKNTWPQWNVTIGTCLNYWKGLFGFPVLILSVIMCTRNTTLVLISIAFLFYSICFYWTFSLENMYLSWKLYIRTFCTSFSQSNCIGSCRVAAAQWQWIIQCSKSLLGGWPTLHIPFYCLICHCRWGTVRHIVMKLSKQKHSHKLKHADIHSFTVQRVRRYCVLSAFTGGRVP